MPSTCKETKIITYFEMQLAFLVTCQGEALASTVRLFHSIIFVKHLSGPWTTCFLDQRVKVTRLSAWKLFSIWSSVKWLSSSSSIWLAMVDLELEINKGVAFGDELALSHGLVCVATSFLVFSILSSAYQNNVWFGSFIGSLGLFCG